jgi:signal transduction histidine kinase
MTGSSVTSRRIHFLLAALLLTAATLLRADPAKLAPVEATTGPESNWAEAADGVESVTNGWKVPQDQPHSLVMRFTPALNSGRLRVWLAFYGGSHFDEFSLSVTTDPNPSRASAWEPLFPTTFNTNQGELARSGEHLRILGAALSPFLRIDNILPPGAITGLKIDVWPVPGNTSGPAVLTEIRADRVPIPTTDVALGCPVTASGDVGAEQNPRFLTDGLSGTYVHPASADPAKPFFFEIDLRRVCKIDHIALRSRAAGTSMDRLSRLQLALYDEKPTEESVPSWSAEHRSDGTYPEPGLADNIRASNGQGKFRGRYLRISSSSSVPFSPQLAEVEVYESIVVPGVTVKANDRELPREPKIRVASTTNWLTFALENPRLPEKVALGRRWRLTGGEWQPANQSGVIESRGLPVGQYLLEVQLRHTDFQWNEAALRVPILVLTPWWQKPGTLIGAALLALGVTALGAWQLARYRMAQRFAELERRDELANERRRIARDMHDVVGSRLTQLTVMQELFASQQTLPESAQEKLQELTDTARAAIASLDEAVWAINPRNDTMQNVADYLSHAASDYLRPLGIACRQDVQETWPDKSVGAQTRHQLLLAFKEALQNIVKHAGATTVTLTLRFTEPDMLIFLEDNGRGLPIDLTGPGRDGLVNMSARLAEAGGLCVVRPRPEGGTRVEMRLTF